MGSDLPRALIGPHPTNTNGGQMIPSGCWKDRPTRPGQECGRKPTNDIGLCDECFADLQAMPA